MKEGTAWTAALGCSYMTHSGYYEWLRWSFQMRKPTPRETRSLPIMFASLGRSFVFSGPVSLSFEQRSLPAEIIQDSPSLWLRACKSARSILGPHSIYLICLFTLTSLFLHLLGPLALPTLEASLFTLMCCEHDSGLLIKQGSLAAARAGSTLL